MASSSTKTAARASAGVFKPPYANPTTPTQYSVDLLTYLGDPIKKASVDFLNLWQNAESATAPGFNPYGTTEVLPGSYTYPGNTAGVQEYPNLQEGLQASADMLAGGGPQTTPLAPLLVADLRAGTADVSQLSYDMFIGNPLVGVSWAGSYQGGKPVQGDNAASYYASHGGVPTPTSASKAAFASLMSKASGSGLIPNWSSFAHGVSQATGDVSSAVANATGIPQLVSGITSTAEKFGLIALGLVFLVLGLFVIAKGSNSAGTPNAIAAPSSKPSRGIAAKGAEAALA